MVWLAIYCIFFNESVTLPKTVIPQLIYVTISFGSSKKEKKARTDLAGSHLKPSARCPHYSTNDRELRLYITEWYETDIKVHYIVKNNTCMQLQQSSTSFNKIYWHIMYFRKFLQIKHNKPYEHIWYHSLKRVTEWNTPGIDKKISCNK